MCAWLIDFSLSYVSLLMSLSVAELIFVVISLVCDSIWTTDPSAHGVHDSKRASMLKMDKTAVLLPAGHQQFSAIFNILVFFLICWYEALNCIYKTVVTAHVFMS